ncbi:hypothetical protein RQP46_011227 [Phenoliferia psychrophenolica]
MLLVNVAWAFALLKIGSARPSTSDGLATLAARYEYQEPPACTGYNCGCPTNEEADYTGVCHCDYPYSWDNYGAQCSKAAQCQGGEVSGARQNSYPTCGCIDPASENPDESACPACPTGQKPACVGQYFSFSHCGCACDTTGGYEVDDSTHECVKQDSTPGPSQAKRNKRSTALFTPVPTCPGSETSCRISALGEGFECLDIRTSLDSCGGCLVAESAADPVGTDCLAIAGAMGVSCVNSRCLVSSCMPGWDLVDGACSRGSK